MVTKQIAWQTGSGNITLTYQGQGDGPVTVESDENNGAARSQVITIETTKGSPVVTRNLTVSQAACPFPVGDVRNYAYTGGFQSVELPAGQYKLQCWGAQGGSNAPDSSYGITAKAGGKGGYSEGVITLSQKTIVKVYVGGQGSSSAGGFNGGGSTTGTSTYDSGNELGVSKMGGGGGATDIRLSDGALLSRMIVAGGGGGGAMVYKRTTSQQTITDITSSSYSLIYDGYNASDGTSSSLWSNSNTQTGNNWGSFGFEATRSGYITSVTIQAVTSYSSNMVQVYSKGGSSPLRSVSVVGTISIGTGTYQLQEPLYVQAGEIVCFSGAGFKYKTSGGDCDTYTGGTYDGAQRIYSFNFNYSYVDKCYVENYTGLVAGQTYNLSGLSGSYYYVKFTKSANIWASSQEITYISPSSFTVPSGYPYFHVFTEIGTSGTLTISHSESVTSESNDSQVGYVGGGESGSGYSNTYKGRQNAAGSGGSFGQGANQTATNYRYCSGAGGGGWYGGGMDCGDGDMDNVKCSGGGSGFVNTSASAGNRPSGYTGLQLDSGETKAGNTSFPSTSGGTETGHSGNGYARITRIA